jgi:hypothetical protein
MDVSNAPFNTMIFTETTQKTCICTASSIFLIFLFVISPLSNFLKTSFVMKIITLLLMAYTLYLNNIQIGSLKQASLGVTSEQLKSQLNLNIICSYVFTLFIILLIICVVKSFF